MLNRYHCVSLDDYENALKEIIQEIALLGMWRAKFFEVGAFYGGTALRILYGLDRFSEDMDFSLLKSDPNFDISKYEKSLQTELSAFGFEVEVEKKHKQLATPIESAFIKANTMVHLLKVRANVKTHGDRLLKIKLEVDTDPPPDFETEVKTHFIPIPFSVKTFTLPTLFAGKMAATLFRPYKKNTKGRDWYDFLWYISRGTKLNSRHLKSRMVQIGKWNSEDILTRENIIQLMNARIDALDIDQAIADVLPFVKDQEIVRNWTKDLFRDAVSRVALNSAK